MALAEISSNFRYHGNMVSDFCLKIAPVEILVEQDKLVHKTWGIIETYSNKEN